MTELDRLLAQDDFCLVSVGRVKRALEQDWNPVEDPFKELPKDGPILVSISDPELGDYVVSLYCDMSEWDDPDLVKYVKAWKPYPKSYKPREPYKLEI